MPPRGPFGPYVSPTLDPIEYITRRRLLTAIPAIGLIAAGVSCGDDDDGEPEATATPPSGNFPVTIDHALGETTIESQPERVVAVNEGEALDHLLACGVFPVLYGQTPGYDGEGTPSPWAVDAGLDAAAAYAMPRGEPDLERMAAGNPDLIVGAWIPGDQYSVMTGIAPTIIIKDSDAVAWPEMQRMVGRALGREEQAEAALAETERAIEQAAALVESHRSRNVTIGYRFFDEIYIHGENSPIARLVTRLGLSVSGGDDPNGLTILSPERVDALAEADLLLSPWFFPDDQSAFESDPLAQALPAVREGRYVPLPLEIAEAGYTESTLSVRWVIPQLAEALVQAAEGRGKKLT